VEAKATPSMAMVNSIFFMVVRLVGGWLGADWPLSPITYAGAMPDLFRTLVAEGKWPISRGENNFASNPSAAQNRSKPGFNGSENGKFLAKAGSGDRSDSCLARKSHTLIQSDALVAG
jgi:hypothetical protein